MSYTLFVSAESTSGGKTTFEPRRLSETVTSGTFGWPDLGSNNGYALRRVITVQAGEFLDGDVYQFTVTLRTRNGILSTQKSNEFVTI
ncbi:hypothetical protein ACFXAZ_26785 [Streptomyces sp. NPDC059477]|uniref:hypothetical protein n=1 Tax=Streptomyces sp. NPDC059477 TaxID=3346847 RepID=UPI0036A2B798